MLSARTRRGGRGARCPRRGRHGGREYPCLCRGMPVPVPGNAPALPGSSSEPVGADTCARVRLEGTERARAGRSPLSHPAATRGSAPRSETLSRGAPRYFGQGLAVQIHCSSPHLRGGRGCAQSPLPPGAGRGGKAPSPGSRRQSNRAAETFCPLFPPELDSGGLRGRRREERKGGREERGLDRSATLLAAWPGWCSPGEHAHWGGIKGIKAGAPCLSPRSWGSSREQRAARQPAPSPRPKGRTQ